MATQQELADVVSSVVRLEGVIDRLELRISTQAGIQCTAARPHPDRMVFQRGPDVYVCDCTMIYRKDGRGGLVAVT